MKHLVHLDDHEVCSKGLRNILNPDPKGYVHFPGPDEALKYIKACHETRKPIDLVITDFNHPGMNGFHFANQVRHSELRYGLNRTPIVLLSMTSVENELVKEGLEKKIFTKYFPKSVTKEELLAYVESLPEVEVPPVVNLLDAVVYVNSTHKCWVRWIYSLSTYRNLIAGTPNVDSGEDAFISLENIARQLGECGFIYVHERHNIGTRVLPKRGNVAMVDDAYRHGIVIWFDDASTDAMASLAAIVDSVGYEKLTVGYEF